MFQQAGIPDNVAYLALGMVLLFGFLGAWLGSFFWRLRNLRRDIQLLEQIAAEDGPEA